MEDEERRWTDENIDMVALKHFPNIDKERAMSRPILYSNWLSKVTRPCSQPCPLLCDLSVSPDPSSVTRPCSQPCPLFCDLSVSPDTSSVTPRLLCDQALQSVMSPPL